MSTTFNPYRAFRFPAEIINQAVWLYHCYSLSLESMRFCRAALRLSKLPSLMSR